MMAGQTGLTKAYQVIPVFINPILVTLPLVIAFIMLLCRDYNASSRAAYYKVRLFSLIAALLIAIAQASYGYYTITTNYSLDDCNPRPKGTDSEADYEIYKQTRAQQIAVYGQSSMPEYDDHADWVHMGIDANYCAMQNVFSITFIFFFSLMFQVHFY